MAKAKVLIPVLFIFFLGLITTLPGYFFANTALSLALVFLPLILVWMLFTR
jgi:uncharacterized membrane protein YdbT with pleckstrin-like domain